MGRRFLGCVKGRRVIYSWSYGMRSPGFELVRLRKQLGAGERGAEPDDCRATEVSSGLHCTEHSRCVLSYSSASLMPCNLVSIWAPRTLSFLASPPASSSLLISARRLHLHIPARHPQNLRSTHYILHSPFSCSFNYLLASFRDGAPALPSQLSYKQAADSRVLDSSSLPPPHAKSCAS